MTAKTGSDILRPAAATRRSRRHINRPGAGSFVGSALRSCGIFLQLMEQLGQEQIDSILLEGGGTF